MSTPVHNQFQLHLIETKNNMVRCEVAINGQWIQVSYNKSDRSPLSELFKEIRSLAPSTPSSMSPSTHAISLNLPEMVLNFNHGWFVSSLDDQGEKLRVTWKSLQNQDQSLTEIRWLKKPIGSNAPQELLKLLFEQSLAVKDDAFSATNPSQPSLVKPVNRTSAQLSLERVTQASAVRAKVSAFMTSILKLFRQKDLLRKQAFRPAPSNAGAVELQSHNLRERLQEAVLILAQTYTTMSQSEAEEFSRPILQTYRGQDSVIKTQSDLDDLKDRIDQTLQQEGFATTTYFLDGHSSLDRIRDFFDQLLRGVSSLSLE